MYLPGPTRNNVCVTVCIAPIKIRVMLDGNFRQKIDCDDKEIRSRTYQRGSFWVLENFVRARRQVKCHESVTYTTHTDYTFLYNLVPVVQRWRGPVSIALYAPGDDFKNVVDTIFYMRNCLGNKEDMDLVKEWVNFHVYFNGSSMPTVDVSICFGMAHGGSGNPKGNQPS